jgi:transcription elongation GreA/GreB family factor
VPIETQRAWLSADTHDRARIELARLLMERATGSRREHTDEEQRARRIRQLIASAAIGFEPPDDGIAEPGMVLTVRYEADGSTERFLMADCEEASDDGLAICSPHSPLGAALGGAAAGDRRECSLPGGGVMAVTLLAALPYRHGDHQRTT